MSKKSNKPTETQAVEEVKVEAQVEETKAEAKVEETKAETKAKVYCGPSVRGVVRQYTVFNGEVSELLKAFIEKHPLAESLLVDVDEFAETRKALGTKGSAQAILFEKLRKEL